MFLVRIGELADDESVRVLVSSATNVAVDRILLALRANDFHQFLRVGSLRKIARDILPYSVHRSARSDSGPRTAGAAAQSSGGDASVADGDREAVRDLKYMLANEPHLSAARLSQERVVGVTCAAASFSVLDGQQFPFVLLDEVRTQPARALHVSHHTLAAACLHAS